MTPEERATVTDEGLAAIEERLAKAAKRNMSMHSACGEYECDCHRDMPALIAEIRRLRDEWHNALQEASAELVCEAEAAMKERAAKAAETWVDPEHKDYRPNAVGCSAAFNEGLGCSAVAGIAAAIRALE